MQAPKQPVTPQGLADMLGAAGTYVRTTYTSYRQILGHDKYMAEVGLTDLYIMKAASEANARNFNAKFYKSINENELGADFEVDYHDGTAVKEIYFQAKVLLAGNWADFLYESKNAAVNNYQVVALHEWVEQRQARGYYVIYDSTGIWYADVRKIMTWLNNTHGNGLPNAPQAQRTTCQQIFTALARPTLALADAA